MATQGEYIFPTLLGADRALLAGGDGAILLSPLSVFVVEAPNNTVVGLGLNRVETWAPLPLGGSDGAELVGADGDVLLAAPAWVQAPDYALDLTTVLPAGQVRARATDDALMQAWIANGRVPLSAAQIAAAAGPALPPVTSIPNLEQFEPGWGRP